MEYKGYTGHFSFDKKSELFRGKVSNIHDLIVFQGNSIETMRSAFQDAVNEYIDLCKKTGKKPEKPSSKIDSISPQFIYGP